MCLDVSTLIGIKAVKDEPSLFLISPMFLSICVLDSNLTHMPDVFVEIFKAYFCSILVKPFQETFGNFPLLK